MIKDLNLLLLKNKKLLLLIFILYSTVSISQEKDSLIIWNKNNKLSWSDFLGKNYIYKDNIGANSSLELYNIQSFYNNKTHSYTIVPVFNRYHSFSLSKNEKLLKHEQVHFDILEIFARKIRQEFEELKKNNASHYLYSQVFNNYIDSLDVYQKMYDFSTDYSLLSKKQEFWETIVAKKLEELNAYSMKNLYGIKEDY